MDSLLEARLEDLSAACEKNSVATATGFLTPAEQEQALAFAARKRLDSLLLTGGNEQAERKLAIFLPFYESAESFDVSPYITAFRSDTRFSKLEHRDFLGALLGLGIERKCVGDIYPSGDSAYFYVLPQISRFVAENLEKAGRSGLRLTEIPLEHVILPERRVEKVSFTVQSMRFDAVLSGMFGISRSEAARQIEQGLAFLNYVECVKTDAEVEQGDVLTLRGKGKGSVAACDGRSRKGRTFVNCEINR